MSDEKMSREKVLEEVVRTLSEVTGAREDEITEDTNLKTDLDFDDLDRIELCMDLEERLDVDTLDEEKFENFETVRELVDHVTARLK